MNTEEPLVSIIILNYNAGKLIENCIESIHKSDYKNFEIILVDNVSTDNSQNKCKKKFPEIKLIQNQENLGYCGGNNIGIKTAKGEFIVILNPDTIVEKSWLKEFLQEYKKIGLGLYQPKLLALDDTSRINSAGNMIQIFGFGYSFGKGEKENSNHDKNYLINYASGACLFTTKQVLEKIGFFDDFLFAYHDDLELGWRARQLGIKSHYVPRCVVYHAESFSFGWSKKKYFLLERNRHYCLLTHYSRKTFFKMLPSLIIIEIIVIMFYLSKGMIKEKIEGYSNILKNWNGIKKKYLEIESKKEIKDVEIIKEFKNQIEIPSIVTGRIYSKKINYILNILSKFFIKIL
ncbi:glycosyltransferase family 2 protein [Nitrosopumilus maritimus]|uniref:Glycosyl transferase family 2 n=1 Tax=Nitrosopumilus maritimus (strain SCM1) TaxID=436308 RepID=A9A162_NITMS|nr:glycosyltransferase family 2 protein [Nitrosopumilus maritimus]ABX12023.1 glycosyl transferase family 2 [Nitrosopumilus maritimus SCM1]